MLFRDLIRHPGAFLPVVMSAVALGLVCAHIIFFGTARQPDEGTAAHLWQLLMAAQLPLLAFFAFRWLLTNTRAALWVMAVQAAGALAALAPVYFLHW